MNRSPTRIAPLLVWLTALLAGGLLLLRAGSAVPAPPADPARWGHWLASGDPLVTAFAGLRLVGLALCAYLLATTTLSLLAAMSGLPRLLRAVDVVTLPGVRALVRGALGMGVAASIAWSAQVAPARAQTPTTTGAASGTAVMHLLDTPPASTTSTLTAPTSAPRPSPTMSTTPTTVVAPSPPTTDPPQGAPQPATAPPAPAGNPMARSTPVPLGAGEPGTWTIAPGDHLWRVAERTLAGAWERPPTDAETSAYLRDLIETNRDRLAVPGHPDLVYSGQVFALPPPPPR